MIKKLNCVCSHQMSVVIAGDWFSPHYSLKSLLFEFLVHLISFPVFFAEFQVLKILHVRLYVFIFQMFRRQKIEIFPFFFFYLVALRSIFGLLAWMNGRFRFQSSRRFFSKNVPGLCWYHSFTVSSRWLFFVWHAGFYIPFQPS